MKKLILIVGLTLVTIKTTNTTISHSNICGESMIVSNNLDIKFLKLVHSLILVESNNGRFLHDTLNHDAIGVLQIRPTMVDEVNRLIGSNEYEYSDRWDSIKSIEMFKIFQDRYNPDYDFHKGCRIWNGGPKGHHKESTLCYLNKALVQLETIINNF